MFRLNNGNVFPLIGFGTFRIRGEELIRNVIDVALNAGYRSFDTAAVYLNEEDIGNALIELLPKYNLKREDIYITTKLGPSDQGSTLAKAAARKSLKNLKVSYIDLYLIHWPGVANIGVQNYDNARRRKESWHDLVDLHREGLLKNLGVSNYTVKHLTELLADCKGVKPCVNQVEFHPKHKQTELLEFCKKEGILLQAYNSLGGTGRSDFLLEDEIVKQVAKRNKKKKAQVLLKWALQHGAAIIPKSITPSRIQRNIQLDFTLDEDSMKLLDSIEEDEKLSWDPQYVK